MVQSAPDSGTHSAAGLGTAAVVASRTQSGLVSKNLRHLVTGGIRSENLVMLRIPAGHFGRERQGKSPETTELMSSG